MAARSSHLQRRFWAATDLLIFVSKIFVSKIFVSKNEKRGPGPFGS
jgi:hypothetical protein